MAKRTSTAIGTPIRARESKPLSRIGNTSGAHGLPREAGKGLPVLAWLAGDAGARIARSVVDWTFARDLGRRRGLKEAPPISVQNRRKRAARAWVETLIAGRVDSASNHLFASVWMPQLAGTGPDLAAALPSARELCELVRGAFAALIFAEPDENLVPRARAMHAVEVVLGRQLAALANAAERGVKNRP